jgi:hypothetical protein
MHPELEQLDHHEGSETEASLAEAPVGFAQLAALWEQRRGERLMPARRDFRFEDFVPWLGHMHLIEIEPNDFLFRIFGTTVADWLGVDFTGRRLSQVAQQAPTVAAKALVGYRRAIESAKPIYCVTLDSMHLDRRFGWSRLLLPLGEAGQTTHLVVVLHYMP